MARPSEAEIRRRRAAYLVQSRENVRQHGWMLQAVFPTAESGGFPFVYTVGLCVAGLPELVIAGLPSDGQVAGMFLNVLAQRTLTEEPKVGFRWTVDDLVWQFGPVSDAWAWENVTLPRVLWPNIDVSALQVFWPDDEGNPPVWPGWKMGDAQPILAEPGA